MTYTFRLLTRLAPQHRLAVESFDTMLHGIDGHHGIRLQAFPKAALSEADHLLLIGSDYADEIQAAEGAQRALDALRRACARLHIGLDVAINDRPPNERVRPISPVSVSFSHAFAPTVSVGINPGRLERAYQSSLAMSSAMTAAERLAYDLLALAWFATPAKVRLLLLFMSIEALVDQGSESDEVREHVTELMRLTSAAPGLSHQQRRDILARLGWLKRQSIRAAGRALVQRELGNRLYDGSHAVTLFDVAYDLRNAIAHGHVPAPSDTAMRNCVHSLIPLASDLIAGELRDIEA